MPEMFPTTTGRFAALIFCSFEKLEQAVARFARRRTLAVATIVLLVLLTRLALIPRFPVHAPSIHDEYSLLLAADTFASGRLTNPPHLMWRHFETFHILFQPTYMSFYPPGQALLLAAGQLLGHPWIAVLLSTALLCGLLCWMLQGWVPPGWALLGSALFSMRLGVYHYWMNSYWGGTLAAIGGVLVLGVVPRALRRPSPWHGFLLGLGLVILANTRPWEGALFAIPVAGWLLIRLLYLNHRQADSTTLRVLGPLVFTLCIAGAAMTYYFWRVTGNPLRLPYVVGRQTYAVAPVFLWEKPRPAPAYRHEILRKFFVEWEPGFQHASELDRPRVWLAQAFKRLIMLWRHLLFAPLLVPLACMLFWWMRDRRMRMPLLTAAVIAAGMSLQRYVLPHYFAPAAGLLYLFVIQGMRHLNAGRFQGLRVGHWLTLTSFAFAVASFAYNALGARPNDFFDISWGFYDRGNTRREQLLRKLSARGLHLVIVRYSDKHNLHEEWVFNRADIDRSAVVWARDMGRVENEELIRYYGGRYKVWLLEPDCPHQPALTEYESGASNIDHPCPAATATQAHRLKSGYLQR